ncbi:hypothetical protein GGQ74_001470 [Desulfobaculum xiamenense]|uniref:DUF4079 domain-containing protein n=1 Tax=Desulfobaculum xiamenense TaxID=995050 RepID=A0A846QLA2_9BACT|nr:DUF4079 family protein [Desulfobaculum xiamenense]NJB67830.1 hypothetical protein [Desulfobaculum xiamenense]
MLLWIHPALQLACTLLACHVLWLGARRFMALHLGRKRVFNWKRHALLGRVVLIVWFVAFVWGAAMTRIQWGSSDLTGTHYVVGLVMLPLLITGYATGEVLDRKRARRTVLPLVHGANNLLLFALAVWQVVTGVWVVRTFLLS